MNSLKRSLFWASFYLAIIFILGQTDSMGRPIINFASYFYLAVIIAIPGTLFFPYISRISSFVPLLIWAVIYLILLQVVGREPSANTGEFAVIVLEFILLEVGVWFAYELAAQIGQSDSVLDSLALSAFPNSAHEIEEESQRIKIELTRSRRYHRPLSLVAFEPETNDRKLTKEMLRNIQYDLTNRFMSARIGQIIDDKIRQTDLVMKDRRGRFIILCPETDLTSVTELAKRIESAVIERVDVRVRWGAAAFPEEALTFDDLLNTARERLTHSIEVPEEQLVVLNM